MFRFPWPAVPRVPGVPGCLGICAEVPGDICTCLRLCCASKTRNEFLPSSSTAVPGILTSPPIPGPPIFSVGPQNSICIGKNTRGTLIHIPKVSEIGNGCILVLLRVYCDDTWLVQNMPASQMRHDLTQCDPLPSKKKLDTRQHAKLLLPLVPGIIPGIQMKLPGLLVLQIYPRFCYKK